MPLSDVLDGSLSSPYTLTRVNPWPFRPLSFGATNEYADAFTRLVSLDDRFAALCTQLATRAELQIAEATDAHHREELIRVRRRIRLGKMREEVLALDKELASDAIANRSERAQLTLAIETRRDSAIADEITELIRWASDPTVQNSVSMTSTSLAAAVIRLAQRASLDKSGRRSLAAFVRYHSRTIARVSPFSGYTAVRADFDGDDVLSDDVVSDDARSEVPLRVMSQVSVSRLVYRHLFRLILLDGNARQLLRWRRSDLVEPTPEGLRVHSRRPKGRLSSRFEGMAEQTTSIRATSPWWRIAQSLDDIDKAGETLETIGRRLQSTESCTHERAVAIVGTLREFGLLVPCPPTADNSEDFGEEWRRFLVDTYGGHHRLVTLHDDTENAKGALADLGGAARVKLLDDLHAAWTTALRPVLDEGEELTNDLFLEDCYVVTGARFDLSNRSTWQDDVRDLFPLLRASDNHALFAQVVDNAFVERFGDNGTCDSLIELAECVAARVERAIGSETSGVSVYSFEPELAPGLQRARLRARALLARCTQPNDCTSVELSDDDLLLIAAELGHESPERRRTTMAVHGQPVGDFLVVNHLYGGPGIYLSRFCAGLTARQLEHFRQYIRSSVSSEAQGIQLRPVLGFNANLSPLLMASQLQLPNECVSHPDVSLQIADLRVERREGVLRLVAKRNGTCFDLRYFGFLVPFVLPSLERMLTAYWGGPAVSLTYLDEVLLERLRESDRGVVAAPELRFRSLVLARRRWAVAKSVLLTFLEEPARAFVEANLWRTRLGIPAIAFLKPLGHASEGNIAQEFRSAKPTVIDFHSHLHVATLRKQLERLPDAVVFEELNPSPARSGLASDRGRHAAELYFEVDYAPRLAADSTVNSDTRRARDAEIRPY